MSLQSLWSREAHDRVVEDGQALYVVAFAHAHKNRYSAQALLYCGAQLIAASLATMIKKNGVSRGIPMVEASMSLMTSMLTDALAFLEKGKEDDKPTHH